MADGIQIGNDHERMAEVSANALVQETESSSIQIGVDHERCGLRVQMILVH